MNESKSNQWMNDWMRKWITFYFMYVSIECMNEPQSNEWIKQSNEWIIIKWTNEREKERMNDWMNEWLSRSGNAHCKLSVSAVSDTDTTPTSLNQPMPRPPGVYLPATEEAPVAAAYLRMARWTCGREVMTQTSAGFSMAMIARAAKTNFSQVLLKLMTYCKIGSTGINTDNAWI